MTSCPKKFTSSKTEERVDQPICSSGETIISDQTKYTPSIFTTSGG